MPCSPHLAHIPQFLDGTLAAERAAELAAHLVSCEGCRAVMLTQRVPQHGLPVSGPDDPEFWGPMEAALLDELDSMERPAPVRRPTRWLTRRVETRRSTLLAYAAALALAVIWGWSRAPAEGVAAEIAVSPSAAEAPTLEPHKRERASAAPAAYVPTHGSL